MWVLVFWVKNITWYNLSAEGLEKYRGLFWEGGNSACRVICARSSRDHMVSNLFIYPREFINTNSCHGMAIGEE